MIKSLYCIAVIFLFLSLDACMTRRKKVANKDVRLEPFYLLTPQKVFLSKLPSSKVLDAKLADVRTRLSKEPKNYDFLLEAVDIAFYLGKYRDVARYGQRAMYLKKNDSQLREKLALNAIVRRQFKLAEYIISTVNCATSGSCLLIRGVLQYEKREISDAEQSFIAAKEFKPIEFAARLNLALLYLQYHHYSKADEIIKELSKATPDDGNIKVLSAFLAKSTKDPDDILDEIEEVSEKNSRNPWVLHNLAAMHLTQENYDEALEMVKRSLKYATRYSFPIERTLQLEAEIKKQRDKDN